MDPFESLAATRDRSHCIRENSSGSQITIDFCYAGTILKRHQGMIPW